MQPAVDYWTNRYTDPKAIEHHATQNELITRDFVNAARVRKEFADTLSLPSIIEVGCGTGEMAAYIKRLYKTKVYYATDFNRDAINVAKSRHVGVNFWVYDVLRDPAPAYCFVALSSNTLEHFRDPMPVVETMFLIGQVVMLLVPYKQPVTDGYDAEGGAGHVASFDETSFDPYPVIDWFVFKTKGWQHSAAGEEPLQMAVLLGED